MKPWAYNGLSLGMGVCSFLAGSSIYLCFRSTDLPMFRLFPHGELPQWACRLRISASGLNVPEWFRFSLPDGLWLLAYLLIIDGIWGSRRSFMSLLFLTILPIAALMTEILQWAHIVPGVGDWMDMACYLLSILIFLTLNKLFSYEKRR